MKTIYPSKISWWILIFVGVVIIFSIYTLYTQKADYIEYFPLIAVAGFVYYAFTSTKYIIDGNLLVIKSTFLINRKIDILTITQIKETNNPLSAPAASLDRLKITYGDGYWTLVSPKDKEAFLLHIKKIQPNILVIRK